jgi:hypothetical protein
VVSGAPRARQYAVAPLFQMCFEARYHFQESPGDFSIGASEPVIWATRRSQRGPLKRRSESSVHGSRAFAAISSVEGLKLTPTGRMRVQAKKPIEKRRADVIRGYASKGLK